MTTDTPSSRDEEIPTPDTTKTLLLKIVVATRNEDGTDGSSPQQTKIWNLAQMALSRLSAEREKEPEISNELLIDYYKRTLAERDKELAEANAKVAKCIHELGEPDYTVIEKLTAQLLAAQTVNGKQREALSALRDYYKEYSISGVVHKQVEEALALSPDPTLLDEWNPINTAPKDGTQILVYERGYVNHVKWGGPRHQSWVHVPRLGFSDHPTHWRPFSDPRQSTRETEEKA